MMLPLLYIGLLLYLRDRNRYDSEIFQSKLLWPWANEEDGFASGARKDCIFEEILLYDACTKLWGNSRSLIHEPRVYAGPNPLCHRISGVYSLGLHKHMVSCA